MSTSRRRKSYERMRMGLLVLLLSAVAAEWAFYSPMPSRDHPLGMTATIEQNDLSLPLPQPEADPARYDGIFMHNLFSSSRTAPPSSIKRASAISTTQAGSLQIVGIVTAGSGRVALVKTNGSAETQRLHIGDKVADLTVEEISPDYIIFHNNNGLKKVLSLKDENVKLAASSQNATPTSNVPAHEVSLSPIPSPTSSMDPQEAEAKSLLENFWKSRPNDMREPTANQRTQKNQH